MKAAVNSKTCAFSITRVPKIGLLFCWLVLPLLLSCRMGLSPDTVASGDSAFPPVALVAASWIGVSPGKGKSSFPGHRWKGRPPTTFTGTRPEM